MLIPSLCFGDASLDYVPAESDTITYPDNANLDFGTSTLFSIYSWVDIDAHASAIATKGNLAAGASGYALNSPSATSSLRLFLDNGVGICGVNSTTTMPGIGKKSVLGVVETRTSSCLTSHFKIYLSGISETLTIFNNTCNSNGNVDTAEVLRVGSQKTAGAVGAYFDGRMSYTTIWNTALTQADATELAAGVFPGFIKTNNIVFMAPQWGEGKDLSQYDHTPTVSGPSSSADGPPVFYSGLPL